MEADGQKMSSLWSVDVNVCNMMESGLTAGTPPGVGHLLEFERSSCELSIRLQTESRSEKLHLHSTTET